MTSQLSSYENPFSLAYDGLWSHVEAHTLLTELKAHNKVKLDKRRAMKPQVNTADLPELMLIPLSLSGSLQATSSGTRCLKRYQWVLTTGDYRVDEVLFPVSWALYEAMVNAQAKMTKEITYRSENFIKRINLLDSNDGESQASRESNISGWATVQTIEVQMHFSLTSIIT